MAAQIGTVIEGKYEILKQIGKGGMSTVYLAMDKRLNKQWAVKEISRHGIGQNNEEVVNEVPKDAEMMKTLDHPAIPTIVDIIDNKASDYIYIVMDYVEGDSLDKILAEYGCVSQDVVIDWAKQICDALGYLHSQKPPIIYRDMKPANVMLKPEGNIKIIDFGIARRFKEGSLADTDVLGTRGYAPPEQYGGHTDIRSDIYALGMTMHHLLTGADPRPADYSYAPIRQWNPELSEGLERVINKCVSPDPKDRYQNCNELMYALNHYKEAEATYKKKQKRKLASFIVSIVMAVVLAVTGVTTLQLQKKAQTNNYDSLIEISSLDNATANANITKAVAIDGKKQDPDAYEKFMEYIISDDMVTEEESTQLGTLLSGLRASYSDSYDETFADLYYKAGIINFIGYIKSTDNKNGAENSTTIKDRAQHAMTYFAAIRKYGKNDSNVDEKDTGNYKVSEPAANFYNICEFYKTDVGYSTKNNDYKTMYGTMFESINNCIDYLDTVDSLKITEEGGADYSNFLKAAMYKATIDFIHTNISEIARFSGIDKNTVITLLDTVKEKNKKLKDAEVPDKNGIVYQTILYVDEKLTGSNGDRSYQQQVELQYSNLDR